MHAMVTGKVKKILDTGGGRWSDCISITRSTAAAYSKLYLR